MGRRAVPATGAEPDSVDHGKAKTATGRGDRRAGLAGERGRRLLFPTEEWERKRRRRLRYRNDSDGAASTRIRSRWDVAGGRARDVGVTRMGGDRLRAP